MEIKLKEFEVKFVEKMDDLDETFQSIVRRQNNTDKLDTVQHEESVRLIEEASRELHNNIVRMDQDSIKEYEEKLEGRNSAVEMAFRDIAERLNNMEVFAVKEREEIDMIR